MASIPSLNYFMEKESARLAVKSFSSTLQKAFKEYKKVLSMYLDLVRKNEEANSRLLIREKDPREAMQKGGNKKCSKRIYFEELDSTNSVHSMEDASLQCTLDLHSSMESLVDKNISEGIRNNSVSGSPVFNRSNSCSSVMSKKNSLQRTISGSPTMKNNVGKEGEQESGDKTSSAITTSSTSNVSSSFLSSTPSKSKKWRSGSKRQSPQKGMRSKTTTPLSGLKKRNNLANLRKERALKKMPLRIINNVSSISRNVPKNCNNTKVNTRPYDIQVMLTPSSRKLKQTKLVFHKTKRTIELTNPLKATDTSVSAKTDKLASDREQILKESTTTDTTPAKETETNNECTENILSPVEAGKDTTQSNLLHPHTHLQIKDESVIQQAHETNDPLNTSSESDSTFFSEYDYYTNLNRKYGKSFGLDNIHVPLVRLKKKAESPKGPTKKRCVESVLSEPNTTEIIDVEPS